MAERNFALDFDFIMLMITNCFCLFLLLHFINVSTDSGERKVKKNYFDNRNISESIMKDVQSNFKDLLIQEINGDIPDTKQLENILNNENKLRRFKGYNNNNNKKKINDFDNSNDDNIQYEKNLFKRYNIKSNLNSKGRKENIKGNKGCMNKTKNNKSCFNISDDRNYELDKSFKKIDDRRMNPNKIRNSNKNFSNVIKNETQPTLELDNTLRIYLNKTKSINKYNNNSNEDGFFKQFFLPNKQPFEKEFSTFFDKFFRLNPMFSSSHNILTDFHKNNKPLDSITDQEQIMKSEIGERIKLHQPMFSGDLRLLNNFENKLNNPLLPDNLIINNVFNVKKFISTIEKTPRGKLQQKNISNHNIIMNQDLFNYQSSHNLSPFVENDAFFTNNLKNSGDNFRELKNNMENDDNNSVGDKKNYNFIQLNNKLNKNENLQRIENSLELDDNQNLLRLNIYSQNKNNSPHFSSLLSNDHLDEVNKNDDSYHLILTNTFNNNHEKLIPSSELLKNLNKRGASLRGTNAILYNHEEDSKGDDEEIFNIKQRNDKSKVGKKNERKKSDSDQCENDNNSNKGLDDASINELCRTFSPKKQRKTKKTTTEQTDEECDNSDEETDLNETTRSENCVTTTCETTTEEICEDETTSEPTICDTTTTTCEPPTTTCEPPTTTCEPPTTTCEPPTTTCEPPTTTCETTTTCEPITTTIHYCEPEVTSEIVTKKSKKKTKIPKYDTICNESASLPYEPAVEEIDKEINDFEPVSIRTNKSDQPVTDDSDDSDENPDLNLVQ